MNPRPQSASTVAYHVHAMIAFTVALAVVVIGELYLPVPGWTRAFLALGTVFLVSATFTLSKSVRDQHESDSVVNRIDQVRVQRLLAEFDPYRAPHGEGSYPDPAQPHGSAPVGPQLSQPVQPTDAPPWYVTAG